MPTSVIKHENIIEADTFPKLLRRNFEQWGKGNVAMRQKDYGIWQEFSWEEEYRNIKHLSLGLIGLGLEPGDKVCILGDSEPEWFWGEMAVQASGGIVVGLFEDAIPAELKYIINHSEAKFVIAGDQEQVDKILLLGEEIPSVLKVIYWEPKGLDNYVEPILVSFAELTEAGSKIAEEKPGLFEQNVARGKGGDTALLFYTSGTTGSPKGVTMPYKNMITLVTSLVATSLKVKEKDNQYSFFPPAWIAEQTWGFALHYKFGTTLHFSEKPETALQDMREISPVMAVFGPRQWESIVSTIQMKTRDAAFIKRKLFELCLPVGYKVADLKLRGQQPGRRLRFLHFWADLVVFRPLKDKLGLLQTREVWTGSAALSPDNFRFLHALGIRLKNTFGCTESSGTVTGHTSGDIKIETVGPPYAGAEVRISDQGEILLGGPTITTTGYYKDPQATQKAFSDGWFHTSDAGYLTEEGHLVWLDRLSELGELADGTKYSPTFIEGKLKFSTFIKDAMVVGGKNRPYTSAIINIDFENTGKWAEEHNIPYTTFVDLSQKTEVSDLILKDVRKANAFLPEPSRLRKVVFLHKEFDPDEGELTRTRKLRRAFMEQKYQTLIDAVYQDKEGVKVETPVTYRDGRKGTVGTTVRIWEVGKETVK